MRRFCFVTALGFALGLASCGMPSPQSPTKSFKTAAERVTSLTQGFFRLPQPADRPDLQRIIGARSSGADIGMTPCTVTGNVTFLVGVAQQTAQLYVDVTQPTTGPPSGRVMVNQTVAPPFGLASDSITAVVCDGNAAAITGTLVGGGNFLLAIYPTPSIVTKNVVFVTPYYVIGGPIIEGSLDIDVPLGEAGRMPSRLKP